MGENRVGRGGGRTSSAGVGGCKGQIIYYLPAEISFTQRAFRAARSALNHQLSRSGFIKS